MTTFLSTFAALFIGIATGGLPMGAAQAQQPISDKVPPITLRSRTALPGVYGRMDHYGYDTRRGNLIVQALGNNTVEIINSWNRIHTITGLEHPQGSVYVPGVDRIFVNSQSGKTRIYDAGTFALLKTLDFGARANADNIRYDAAAKLVYVGYGEDDGGAMGVVDPMTMERVKDIKLGSHPEAFALEQKGPRIFVNLPDQESFGVIDRTTGAVTKWKIPGNTNNHTMALDEANHRVFACALQPGRLTVVDTETGKVVATLPCVLGVDDIWYDAVLKRIYAPGSGAIDVFQQVDADHYNVMARIPVGAGAGSTSYYLRTRTGANIYMSWPNMLPQGGSEVLLFYVNE
jgi:DNA-binding beta-propeller fold protein YncE